MRTHLICAVLSAALTFSCFTVASDALAGTTSSAQVESHAEDALKQVKLTAKQIEGFLDGNEAIGEIVAKIPEDRRDEPDAAIEASLDKVARGHGFGDFGEFERVASNIEFLLEGFDPKSKLFIGQEKALEHQISAVEADDELRPREKARQLQALKSELSNVPTVTFASNIDLVAKYYDRLIDAFDANE